VTTRVLPEGSYYGETGFLANTERFRGSMRFSTPLAKSLLTDPPQTPDAVPTLLKQTTERNFNNNSFTNKPPTDTESEDEYLQSYTFITETYADLRYIPRAVRLSLSPSLSLSLSVSLSLSLCLPLSLSVSVSLSSLDHADVIHSRPSTSFSGPFQNSNWKKCIGLWSGDTIFVLLLRPKKRKN
jgi:hypothetical protein